MISAPVLPSNLYAFVQFPKDILLLNLVVPNACPINPPDLEVAWTFALLKHLLIIDELAVPINPATFWFPLTFPIE